LNLTNVSSETVDIIFLTRSPSSWLRFKVYDETNRLVFESSTAAWPALTKVTLKPGDFIDQKHEWKQINNEGHELQAGTYKIIGFIYNVNTPQIILETPPVKITIA
jgi:hypothetical protein